MLAKLARSVVACASSPLVCGKLRLLGVAEAAPSFSTHPGICGSVHLYNECWLPGLRGRWTPAGLSMANVYCTLGTACSTSDVPGSSGTAAGPSAGQAGQIAALLQSKFKSDDIEAQTLLSILLGVMSDEAKAAEAAAKAEAKAAEAAAKAEAKVAEAAAKAEAKAVEGQRLRAQNAEETVQLLKEDVRRLNIDLSMVKSVLDNRVVLEQILRVYYSDKSLSMKQLCKEAAKGLLNKGKFSKKGQQLYEALGCTAPAPNVLNELEDIMHEESKPLHHGLKVSISKLLPGFYVGGEAPLGYAVAMLVLHVQDLVLQDGKSLEPVNMKSVRFVGADGVVKGTLEDGKFTPTVEKSSD